MMRQGLKTILLKAILLLSSVSAQAAQAALPVTPLEPVYHALFSQRNGEAWQQLINLWPQMTSTTQRTAWRQAVDAVVAGQCGNDLPVTVPAWLDHPTLALIQRDIPLNRIYRLQFSGKFSEELSGKSTGHDLKVSLTLPDGEEVLGGVVAEYDDDGQFRVESQERGAPLPAGIYHLTVRSGSNVWQQTLALAGSSDLNWVQRQGQNIHLQRPSVPVACPSPWLEQSLLRRGDYQQIWWQRDDALRLQPWPTRTDAESLWANVTVVRAEARGGLTLRLEHRLAGPLVTLQH